MSDQGVRSNQSYSGEPDRLDDGGVVLAFIVSMVASIAAVVALVLWGGDLDVNSPANNLKRQSVSVSEESGDRPAPVSSSQGYAMPSGN